MKAGEKEKEKPITIGILPPGQLLSTETAEIINMAPSKVDVLRWAAGLDPDFPATSQELRAWERRRKGSPGLKFEFRIGK